MGIKKEKGQPTEASEMRHRAEEQLGSISPETLPPRTEGELHRLLHELEVQRVELEIQNAELRHSRDETEAAFEKYSDLYDFAPVGYFTLDRDGIIRAANLTGASLLGIERSRLLGRSFDSLVKAEARHPFCSFLEKVFSSRSKEAFEVALRKAGKRPLHLQIEAVAGNSGQECRLAVIDVSARREVEEELRESERRYRSLFENMLEGFAYCRMLFDDLGRPVDFIYLDVNNAFGRLTGLKDVKGKRVTDLIPGIKESSPELFETYGRVALTGKPERFEIDFKPLALWLSVSVYSLEREYFVAVFADITMGKRAECVVQARLRMLAAANLPLGDMLQMMLDEIEALTGSEIGFYHFFDADQETLSLQKWSTNTLANMCSAEGEGSHYPVSKAGVWVDCIHERRAVIHNDYVSLPHRKGMPPGHAPVIREMVIPILREERIVAIIGVGNKPSEYNTIDVETASLLGDFSWEIVERKLAEEKLRIVNSELAARASELEAANIELEAFNYMVAHDLRAPLSNINGYTQVVHNFCSNQNEECAKYLREIYGSTLQMDRLIKALLNFSRILQVKLHHDTVDLSAVAQGIAASMRLKEPECRVTFQIADGINVTGDAGLLRIVLDNLIGNAWKYSGKRDGTVIEFGVTDSGKEQALFVRDNGPGFDMAHADKLFTPFQRLPGASAFQGHGIGLATVQRIVSRHGGRVWAESAPGQGASFYFTLAA